MVGTMLRNFLSGGRRAPLGALLWCGLTYGFVRAEESLADLHAADATVGRRDDGTAVTPVNQIVTPYGKLIDLPGMRPQAIALSPDGRTLVVTGKTNALVVLDPETGEVNQRVPFPSDDARIVRSKPASSNILQPDRKSQVSYTGLRFSGDGSRLYLSNVEGLVEVFRVEAEGRIVPADYWPLPAANAPRRAAEIPAGIAESGDGARLYVCGNLSNRLLELDATDGKVLRTFDVGVAPYDVALVGGKAYVSNWGGRRPGPDDLTGPAGRGTTVRVDPRRHIASEGSASVVDLAAGEVVAEIPTGLHASGLAVSPDRRLVVCCNAASDTLTVIDAAADRIVATLWAKASPAELLGAAPNAAVFDSSGERLYVANGSQNAIATFEFRAEDPARSRLAGLIPVGWYPGALAFDPRRRRLAVANVKGLPTERRRHPDLDAEGFNTHHYFGSVSMVPLPDEETLAQLSQRVALNQRAPRIAEARLPPRPDQPPRAIPRRIGEPSLIKHVVYVIKENRTYDQVLGDLPQGNGDPQLCVFGRRITPNQHKLAEEFVLLDNAYCSGILSADGHQWSTTAYSTDYMEKSFAGFPRSYPDGMGVDEDDALAYAPSGFLWDNAIEHGVTLRNYGEFMGPAVRWRDESRPGEPDFAACYRAWKSGGSEVVFESWPSVESLRPFSPVDFVGWNMSVPDQWRADYVLADLKRFEAAGEMPQLVIICLPQDHTSGTSPGCPTPAACMADNDLALGRIVEAFSRSKFWPETAIFAIEDDPQAGWDHVSGYRTIALCASPYAKRGAVVGTQYNTTSVIRTIEQILGLPPMNQFDASATPMFDCFQDEPNLAPFTAVPVETPLDEMNPTVAEIADPMLREDALVSARLNFKQVDRAPEDVLNRILWRAMRGAGDPYPEWAISVTEDDDDEFEADGAAPPLD
ncbi:MAG: phosphoesterase [Pirellulales bacterium]|nr:phosphoesterase [Pirellulales bacterium]